MIASETADLIASSLQLESAGQVGAALARGQAALAAARATGDADGTACALVRLGQIYYRLGHFQEMRAFGEQAQSCAPPGSPARAEALILFGHYAMEVGSLDEAESHYLAAADLGRQTGHDLPLLSALHDLAVCVYALGGQFDLALASDEEAYRLACRLGSRHHQATTLVSMAFIHLNLGNHRRMRQMLVELAPLVADSPRFQGYRLWLCAALAQAEGDLPAASAFYAEARSAADATGDLGLNVFLRLGQSSCHQQAGNGAAAYEWANDGLAWANRMGTRRLIGRALTERGRSAWINGDLAAAEEDLRAAADELRSRQQRYDLARAHLLLGALLFSQGRHEADPEYVQAVSLIAAGGFAYLVERERGLAFPLVAHYVNHPDPAIHSVTARLLAHLDRVPPAPLRVVTLGDFAVYRRTQRVPASAWRRQAGELLRLLVVSPGRSLAREQVMEALWPEKPLAAATIAFHQATSALRRALEPDLPDKFPSRYLHVEEGQVTLRLPPDSQVDCYDFEAHVQRGEWQAALNLYQGEPFPLDRYHDWATGPREALIRQGLLVLQTVAARQLESGDPAQALALCRRILAEEPWHEQAVLLAMQACRQQNDRPGALQLYRDLQRRLQDEFGIAPLAELQGLYRAILQG